MQEGCQRMVDTRVTPAATSRPRSAHPGPNVVLASPPGSGLGYMMDTAERDTQVRNFVKQVWNGRNYEAAADLYEQAEVLHAAASERLAAVEARIESLREPGQA